MLESADDQRRLEWELHTRRLKSQHLALFGWSRGPLKHLEPGRFVSVSRLAEFVTRMRRQWKEDFLGFPIPIASPECLIVTKLMAFRGQDQVDIENLLAANPGQLDLDFIRAEWATLADKKDPRFLKFEEMVAKSYLPAPPSQTPPDRGRNP